MSALHGSMMSGDSQTPAPRQRLPRRRTTLAVVTVVLIVVGVILAALSNDSQSDDLNAQSSQLAQQEERHDQCPNLASFQESVPSGYDFGVVHFVDKSPEQDEADLGILRSESGCFTQVEIDQGEVTRVTWMEQREQIMRAEFETYLAELAPVTWNDHLEAAVQYYCTTGYDTVSRAHYSAYWQVSIDQPWPEKFAKAVSPFCDPPRDAVSPPSG